MTNAAIFSLCYFAPRCRWAWLAWPAGASLVLAKTSARGFCITKAAALQTAGQAAGEGAGERPGLAEKIARTSAFAEWATAHATANVEADAAEWAARFPTPHNPKPSKQRKPRAPAHERRPGDYSTYSLAKDALRGSWFWCCWGWLITERWTPRKPLAFGWCATKAEAKTAARAACPENLKPLENSELAERLIAGKRYSADGKNEKERWREEWAKHEARWRAQEAAQGRTSGSHAGSFDDQWDAFVRARDAAAGVAALAALGLDASATLEAVGKAYRQRAAKLHPDVTGDSDASAFITLTQHRDAALAHVRARDGVAA